ncbi:hypothetical protein [Sandaracinus amylolyticus]|uniref:Uncharacterized protein n=1 Tax=Sandaracinus amylolyticus TaxID=927083 RepID=A0A0F6W129_9BACT|nr:hypothetical protein [Sandaracinus amylolyticus]AKF04558.1 hypothetical protein DB32_001707 [Sandaracinus amylolyticus]
MRTDRTFVCTHCRVRSWPVRRCPACGETTSLVDLEQHPDAIARGPRVPTSEPPSGAALTTMLGGAGLLGSVIALGIGAIAISEVGFFVSIPLMVIGAARMKNAPDSPPGDLRYRVLESPIVRARAERVVHTGSVKARGMLRAPLSGRECVAWRLWGEGPYGAIDDAMAVPFAVAIGGGEPDVEVDAAIATIDLPAPERDPEPLPRVDETLARWLLARGVHRPESLRVREAIVEPGALVEVAASARTETKADGYRGARTRDVLADLPGSPLIVRCPPPVLARPSASNA